MPSQIQSNRGEQLVAIFKQINAWDYERIPKWARRRGIK
jgi:hypothetical protein